jgi:hypothetical protein
VNLELKRNDPGYWGLATAPENQFDQRHNPAKFAIPQK